MSIIAIGIDLAKNIFAIHGVKEQGINQTDQTQRSHGSDHAKSYYYWPTLPSEFLDQMLMIVTHVLNRGGKGVQSPLDSL